MLISSKVVDLNNEIYNANIKRREENQALSRRLNPFGRSMFNRTNNLILDVSRTIEEQSGWVYTPECFISKSDYSFNSATNEIVFNINRVDPNDPDCSSTIVKEFMDNNRELLERLYRLERKRSNLIKPYQQSYNNFIIDFNKALQQRKDKIGKKKDLDFLRTASEEFITFYGIDGVKRLVSLLNQLTIQDHQDPIEIYNKQFYGSVTSLYIDELFRWASSFTPRAQYVRDVIERKRWENEQSLTPELREKIR